ncbi:glycosyltransferase [Candidatus Poribacteria bacterium]|nr:glycosyltransferase [Candidatus Poribacteria bacterium]
MERRLKIALIVGTLETGGAQTLVMELMRGLDRRHFEPILIHFKKANHYADEIRTAGWKCVRIRLNRAYRHEAVYRLAVVLKRERIDIVHTHSDFANTAGRVAAAIAGVPHVIAHMHNTYEHRMDKRFLAVESFLAPRTDQFLACSTGVRDYCAARFPLGGRPVRTVVNGINLDPFFEAGRRREAIRAELGIPPDVFHIVHTARLEPHKAPEQLFKALALGVQKGVLGRWRATVLGGGSLEDHLHERIGDYDRMLQAQGLEPIGPRIEFAGWRWDVARYLAAADVFVLSSKNEGLSLSLVEAMAAGTPAIAPDIIGPREVLEGGKDGLLIDATDPGNILDALCRLQADHVLRDRLVVQGLDRARDFSRGRFVSEMQGIYEQVATRPQPRQASPMGSIARRLYFLRFRLASKYGFPAPGLTEAERHAIDSTHRTAPRTASPLPESGEWL